MGHDGFHDDVAGIYKDLHEASPGTVRGVGHRNDDTAYLQYRQVVDSVMRAGSPADMERRSVLDVGCGYGHLSSYLPTSAVDYLGIDTNPIAIDIAKAKFDNKYRTFLERDVLTMDDRAYQSDFVACVGSLAWHTPERAMEIASRCYKLCRHRAIFIMHEDTVAVEPMDIIEYVNPTGWLIDHSWDEHVTSVVLFKERP